MLILLADATRLNEYVNDVPEIAWEIMKITEKPLSLAAHLQSWGGCTVRQATGHPVKAWVSTLPGTSLMNIATRYAAPLRDVLSTLPLFRPASLWPAGAVVYRSRDGRLFPYQPGSEWQGTWNELYFARPAVVSR